MMNITKEFRFALPSYKPYAFPCANNTKFHIGRTLQCTQPGAAYEFFQTYSQSMQVIPKIMWFRDEQVGAYENGTWTGILGMILNDSLDTIAIAFKETDLRTAYFDFSYSFYEVKLVYLVKETQLTLLESILNILLPFDYDVWLLFLATVLALLIAYFFLNINVEDRFVKARSKSTVSSYASVWDYFRYLICCCSSVLKLNSLAGTVLFISGGIFALIMLNLYGGVLLSQLLLDRSGNPFSTAEGVLNLIEQSKYKLIFDRSYSRFWYYQEIATSNDTHYVQLRKALSKNPYAYADNITQALDMVSSGGYILPGLSNGVQVYQAFTFCDIAFVSPTGFPSSLATYMFKKDSPMLRRFNDAVFSTQKLTDRIWSVYYGDVPEEERANYCRQPKTVRPISIDSCFGFFVLLIVGLLLAATTFFAEMAKQN